MVSLLAATAWAGCIAPVEVQGTIHWRIRGSAVYHVDSQPGDKEGTLHVTARVEDDRLLLDYTYESSSGTVRWRVAHEAGTGQRAYESWPDRVWYQSQAGGYLPSYNGASTLQPGPGGGAISLLTVQPILRDPIGWGVKLPESWGTRLGDDGWSATGDIPCSHNCMQPKGPAQPRQIALAGESGEALPTTFSMAQGDMRLWLNQTHRSDAQFEWTPQPEPARQARWAAPPCSYGIPCYDAPVEPYEDFGLGLEALLTSDPWARYVAGAQEPRLTGATVSFLTAVTTVADVVGIQTDARAVWIFYFATPDRAYGQFRLESRLEPVTGWTTPEVTSADHTTPDLEDVGDLSQLHPPPRMPPWAELTSAPRQLLSDADALGSWHITYRSADNSPDPGLRWQLTFEGVTVDAATGHLIETRGPPPQHDTA